MSRTWAYSFDGGTFAPALSQEGAISLAQARLTADNMPGSTVIFTVTEMVSPDELLNNMLRDYPDHDARLGEMMLHVFNSYLRPNMGHSEPAFKMTDAQVKAFGMAAVAALQDPSMINAHMIVRRTEYTFTTPV